MTLKDLTRIWCISIVGLMTVSAQAQSTVLNKTGTPAAIPHKLTLAEAEKLLIERSPAVIAARYQIDAGRAAQLIAGYKPNPILTIGAEQFPVYSPARGSFPRFFATNNDAAAQPTYTLRLDKLIERGGKRELRIAQANAQLSASEAQALDALRTQLFQLRQSFTQAILARETLLLAESTEQQYAQTERLTAAKVENGDLPAVEIYRARAGRLPYEQAVLQARTSYEQATREIIKILGARAEDVEPSPGQVASLEFSAEDAVAGGGGQQTPVSLGTALLEVSGSFADAPLTRTLTELRQTALSQRPDVIAARRTLDAAARGSDLAQAQRKRDLSVGYEYQRVGNDHALGAVVSIPLFVYNSQRAGIAQAQALQRSAEMQLQVAELQAVTEVEKAFQSYQTARRMLELYNSQNLAQVEKLRSIAALSYKEGASSLFELIDAQRAYNLALTAYNQARADYQLSLWQLEYAIGQELW